MYTDYADFRFLFAPRPENAISSGMINYFEGKGWVGTYKLNGTCSLIGIAPDGSMHTMTRHNTPHKAWNPQFSQTRNLAKYVKRDTWTVFAAELMHSKTPNTKDTLYLFDMVVHNSKELIGTTYDERQDMLAMMFHERQGEEDSHYVIENGIWLVKNHLHDLKKKFSEIKAHPTKEFEGLVLKDPNGKLSLMTKTGQNQGWQVKVRVPNFSYSF